MTSELGDSLRACGSDRQHDQRPAATKVLVSACLLGEQVRYDGTSAFIDSDLLRQLQREGRVVPFCPEVAGGLPTPRPPAEITGGEGIDVIQNRAEVLDIDGRDVTGGFRAGAIKAVEVARSQGVTVAILKDRSPSCGATCTHDGSFSGRTKAGKGVTTCLLEQNRIQTFSENQLDQARAYLGLSET